LAILSDSAVHLDTVLGAALGPRLLPRPTCMFLYWQRPDNHEYHRQCFDR